jgi:hemoglobin
MTKNEWILEVLKSFYDKARTDVLIGYHFWVIKDFDTHIPRIASFWEMQLLGKASRKIEKPFDVVMAHLPMGIKRGELDRWLVLFKKTLEEKIATHSEMQELKELWEEKLKQFEGIFSRFLGI